MPINSDASSIQTISAEQGNILQYANPIKMEQNLWRQRELIIQFTKREVLQRYKGSYFGVTWSLVTPLVMLLVYTFIFSVIFQARWSDGASFGSHIAYALPLFAGLLAFNIFSESLLAAPRLIVGNPNYVKKVVFPLEILPVTVLDTSLIHSIFGLIILLLGLVVIEGGLPWTLLLLPIVYLPLILLCLRVFSVSWRFHSRYWLCVGCGYSGSVFLHLLFILFQSYQPIFVFFCISIH